MKKRFDEEQVIRILREADVPEAQIREVCRRRIRAFARAASTNV